MTLSKSKIFLIFCIAFIIGIFLGGYINYETMAVLAMVFIILGTVWWPASTRGDDKAQDESTRGGSNKLVLVLSIAGVIMLLGSLRFILDYKQNDLAQFYGKTEKVTGIISEEPDERVDKTYLTLGNLEINHQKLHSKILLTVSQYSEYEYGQKLNFETSIDEPKEYPDFSYKNYLSRFGIDAVGYKPKIEIVQGNFGFKPKLYILRFKKIFVERLAQTLPEPQNAFLGGLLLGAKHAIPQTLTDEFNRTSTSHIVAVSGFNITIIAAAIDWLLMWLGLRKRLSFILALLGILMFVIMTGATASVVRAGIMGSLLLIAINIGRVNVVANSLAFTAVVMLGLNPQILTFDVGFQLSFAALLGIVYIVPLADPYFLWIPDFLRQILLATIAAQIFTLPILMFNFGQLSLVGLIANILVLPVVPITMLFGFLTGITALIWNKLAIPFSAITWLLLTYILRVIGFFSALSFAAVNWHISIWAVMIYYLIVISIILVLYNQELVIELWNTWKTKPKPSSSF
jgi:competence protein ComEC